MPDDQATQIQQIVDDIIARRARGEEMADSQVIAAHPELAPDLSEQLKLARVRLACDRANSAVGDSSANQSIGASADQASQDQTHSATITANERVGDYEILGLLGKGAMGKVRLARDVVLKRDVAI